MLEIKNLNCALNAHFSLQNINISLNPSERVAIVGESGSGKSSIANIIMRLNPRFKPHNGEVLFETTNLLKESEEFMQHLRGNIIAYIAQDPLSSLNPLHKIGKQMSEAYFLHHKNASQTLLKEQVLNAMKQVQLDEKFLDRYPYELSGGQRQRVCIAMGIINVPKLLICDEPTTALDAQIQNQILDLLKQLSVEKNIALLFISHDLKAVKRLADRVYVLKKGEIVETNSTKELFNDPKHEYSKLLIQASNLPAKNLKALDETLLEVKDFSVYYLQKRFFRSSLKKPLIASVDFSLKAKENIGIIGESGSGKSSLALGLLKLALNSGEEKILGQSVGSLNSKAFKPYRKILQMVFQDPYASLNPRLSIQSILIEALRFAYPKASKEEWHHLAKLCLEEVCLSPELLNFYAYELSGGERQRVAIARAIALKPKIILLDEPTSALDKSIQKSVLELLLNLQEKQDLSYLFISHDLDVIKAFCDRVLVISEGKVVETGAIEEVFENPKHAYTKRLLESRL
ncbi:ABC transporter ATP-binding protein [Helicobacter pylori]|nr:ABC transporter ATP-binding protein [Helicobacter pylori]